MVSITDKALKVLAGVVDRVSAGEGAAPRLVPRPDAEGWTLELDQPGPEDQTFQHEERTVLILDAGAAQRLQESTLDVDDTPDGPRLRLR